MKVIISAAGTGGHINPGIAIANKIKEKEPDSEIVFFGTDRGLENDLVPRAGYKLLTIEAYGIQPKITLKNIRQIIKTMKSYNVKTCIYGHIHGEAGKDAKQGEIDGIKYIMASSDQTNFDLIKL